VPVKSSATLQERYCVNLVINVTKTIVWAAVVLAVFVVATGVIRAWASTRRWLKKYSAMNAEALAAQYQILLKRGRDGAVLVVSHEATNRFVQFRKYIHAPGDYGLSFDFPRAPWSERYYAEFKARLEQAGRQFMLQPTNDSPVTEFILVDCARDLGLCRALAEMVLFEVFALPPESRFKVTAEDISFKDEAIER